LLEFLLVPCAVADALTTKDSRGTQASVSCDLLLASPPCCCSVIGFKLLHESARNISAVRTVLSEPDPYCPNWVVAATRRGVQSSALGAARFTTCRGNLLMSARRICDGNAGSLLMPKTHCRTNAGGRACDGFCRRGTMLDGMSGEFPASIASWRSRANFTSASDSRSVSGESK